MAECKPTDKTAIEEVDLTSISSLLDVLLGAFSIGQSAAQNVPPFLQMAGKESRYGMSARNLAARTISRLESETGVSMGNVYSDGPNVKAMMVKVLSEEMVSMLQTEAKTQVTINPGAILSIVTGVAGIIPVTGSASNTLPIMGTGGIQ